MLCFGHDLFWLFRPSLFKNIDGQKKSSAKHNTARNIDGKKKIRPQNIALEIMVHKKKIPMYRATLIVLLIARLIARARHHGRFWLLNVRAELSIFVVYLRNLVIYRYNIHKQGSLQSVSLRTSLAGIKDSNRS